MATYAQIQWWVKRRHGFLPRTSWIADVMERSGLPVRRAPNRLSDARRAPCPPAKRAAVLDALRHYRMIATPSLAGTPHRRRRR